MGRHVFFAIHFVVGFLLLWLMYQYAHTSLLPPEHPPLWLESAVETSYLVAGVAWGNLGWDALKRIPQNADRSLLLYVLSRTMAPVAVFLPLVAIVLDFFYQGIYLSWRLAVSWENAGLLAAAAFVLVSQRLYARSEKGFFYRAWQA